MTFNVENYLPYIKTTVTRFLGGKGYHPHYEDLVQEGALALLTAHKYYKEESPVSFITYSRRALHGALSEYMKRTSIVVRKNPKTGATMKGESTCRKVPIESLSDKSRSAENIEDVERILGDDIKSNRLGDLFRAAERELTPALLEVFNLTLIEGKIPREIGEITGYSRTHVLNQLKEIIHLLRREDV